MQLAMEEVDQTFLDRYVGGEIVIESNGVLTSATATALKIQGNLISVSLSDISWRNGTLSDTSIGRWQDVSGGSSVALISRVVESENEGVLLFGPTLRDTRARLTPLDR